MEMAFISEKKFRAQKCNSSQMEHLIYYMETHSQFAASHFTGKEGKKKLTEQWERLAMELNSIPNGASKNAKQWQIVWRDMKSKASLKASQIRRERRATGNFPLQTTALDQIERRIVAIVGEEYCVGSQECMDSTPEQKVTQILQEEEEALAFVEVTDDGVTDVDVPPQAPAVATSQRKRTIHTGNRDRTSVQLADAREQFAEISKKNSAVLEEMAKAINKLADACLIQAEAARKATENEKERNEILKELIVSIRNVCNK